MMTSIDHVLEIYGNGIDADDFADQLGDAMRAGSMAIRAHYLRTIGPC